MIALRQAEAEVLEALRSCHSIAPISRKLQKPRATVTSMLMILIKFELAQKVSKGSYRVVPDLPDYNVVADEFLITERRQGNWVGKEAEEAKPIKSFEYRFYITNHLDAGWTKRQLARKFGKTDSEFLDWMQRLNIE